MKRCAKCHVWKQPLEFYRDKNRADGRTPYCKPCQYASKHPGAPVGFMTPKQTRIHQAVLDAFRLSWWGAKE